MEGLKIYVKRGIIGFLIGSFLSYLVLIIYALGSEELTLQSDLLVAQFLMTSVLGFHLGGISVVYNMEEWSLLRQTVTHFIGMLPALPVAYFAGWMSKDIGGMVLYTVIFIAIYVVQWIIFYNYWKKKAIELNEDLERFKIIGK